MSDNGFARFWSAYPRKVGRIPAEQEWRKLAPSETLQADILASLEAHKQTAQWMESGGKFIPHARTFLHQQRWTDELTPADAEAAPIPDRVRKQAEDIRRAWLYCRHSSPCVGYGACVTLIARRLLAQGRAEVEADAS